MAGLMTPVAITTATATAGIFDGWFSTLAGNVSPPLASGMSNHEINELVNETFRPDDIDVHI